MTRLYRRAGRAGSETPRPRTARPHARPQAAVPAARALHRGGHLRGLCSDLAGARLGRRDHARGGAGGGCSVGTLYEYFPNKEALLSVSCAMPSSGCWRASRTRRRTRRPRTGANGWGALRLCCSAEDGAHRLRPRHDGARGAHRRAQAPPALLRGAVCGVAAGAGRLPGPAAPAGRGRGGQPGAGRLGARRYRLLLAPVPPASDWALQMERFCVLALSRPAALVPGHPGPHPGRTPGRNEAVPARARRSGRPRDGGPPAGARHRGAGHAPWRGYKESPASPCKAAPTFANLEKRGGGTSGRAPSALRPGPGWAALPLGATTRSRG